MHWFHLLNSLSPFTYQLAILAFQCARKALKIEAVANIVNVKVLISDIVILSWLITCAQQVQ